MARDKRDEPPWDPEDAHGVVPNPHAYQWRQPWAFYVAVMCGLLGVFALIGGISPFSATRVVGALGVLAGVLTIRFADRATAGDRVAALLWCLATAAVVVGGAALWLSTS